MSHEARCVNLDLAGLRLLQCRIVMSVAFALKMHPSVPTNSYQIIKCTALLQVVLYYLLAESMKVQRLPSVAICFAFCVVSQINRQVYSSVTMRSYCTGNCFSFGKILKEFAVFFLAFFLSSFCHFCLSTDLTLH